MEEKGYFGVAQLDKMREMAAVPPEKRCFCGKCYLGECKTCPPDKTCLDRIQGLRAVTPQLPEVKT